MLKTGLFALAFVTGEPTCRSRTTYYTHDYLDHMLEHNTFERHSLTEHYKRYALHFSSYTYISISLYHLIIPSHHHTFIFVMLSLIRLFIMIVLCVVTSSSFHLSCMFPNLSTSPSHYFISSLIRRSVASSYHHICHVIAHTHFFS